MTARPATCMALVSDGRAYCPRCGLTWKATDTAPPSCRDLPELEDGKALVLVGPQGSGKTTLARRIAEKYGTFKEVPAAALVSLYGLGEALADAPDVLVVEGFPTRPTDVVKLMGLISAERLTCFRRREPARIVNPPRFIFCAMDCPPLDDRRFRVIRL